MSTAALGGAGGAGAEITPLARQRARLYAWGSTAEDGRLGVGKAATSALIVADGGEPLVDASTRRRSNFAKRRPQSGRRRNRLGARKQLLRQRSAPVSAAADHAGVYRSSDAGAREPAGKEDAPSKEDGDGCLTPQRVEYNGRDAPRRKSDGSRSSRRRSSGSATDDAGGARGGGQTDADATVHLVNGVPDDDEPELVSAGAIHTVVSTASGAVLAWGRGQHGRLGNGYNDTQYEAVPVGGALADVRVTAVAAGVRHTAVVSADGAVFCFGKGASGQLGIGSTASRSTATRVDIDGRVVGVAAGANHTLAWCDDGALWAWGDNARGQLGSGDHNTALRPIQVDDRTSLHSWRGIVGAAAGAAHSLLLTDEGRVLACGAGDRGQLGLGRFQAAQSRPEEISFLESSPVVRVAASGEHSVAVDRSGHVFVWGYRRWAMKGDVSGRDDDHSIANLPMSGMRGALAAPGARVLEVSTGSERTVVIAELDARLAVHGDGNSDGGDATGGGGGGGGLVEAIAAAARETKEAQRRGGAQRSVVSWSDSSEPVEVAALRELTPLAVAVGGRHAVVIARQRSRAHASAKDASPTVRRAASTGEGKDTGDSDAGACETFELETSD